VLEVDGIFRFATQTFMRRSGFVVMLVAVVAGRLRLARADADARVRQEQALHDVALALLAGTPVEGVLRTHLQPIADALGVSAAATIDGRRALIAGEATPELLSVTLPSVRYHAAAFGESGRIVIDSGLRLTRAQTQLVDTLARMLDTTTARVDAPAER
jgi:hypothetical protein